MKRPLRRQTWREGDIALNPSFGDVWVVERFCGRLCFVLYFDGKEQTSCSIDEPIGFVKIGEYKAKVRR